MLSIPENPINEYVREDQNDLIMKKTFLQTCLSPSRI